MCVALRGQMISHALTRYTGMVLNLKTTRECSLHLQRKQVCLSVRLSPIRSSVENFKIGTMQQVAMFIRLHTHVHANMTRFCTSARNDALVLGQITVSKAYPLYAKVASVN